MLRLNGHSSNGSDGRSPKVMSPPTPQHRLGEDWLTVVMELRSAFRHEFLQFQRRLMVDVREELSSAHAGAFAVPAPMDAAGCARQNDGTSVWMHSRRRSHKATEFVLKLQEDQQDQQVARAKVTQRSGTNSGATDCSRKSSKPKRHLDRAKDICGLGAAGSAAPSSFLPGSIDTTSGVIENSGTIGDTLAHDDRKEGICARQRSELDEGEGTQTTLRRTRSGSKESCCSPSNRQDEQKAQSSSGELCEVEGINAEVDVFGRSNCGKGTEDLGISSMRQLILKPVDVFSALKRNSADLFIMSILALNALWMGVELEWACNNLGRTAPRSFRIINGMFCLIFVIELVVIRPCCCMSNRGQALRQSRAWAWLAFDVVVVSLQVFEELAVLLGGGGNEKLPASWALLRMVRVVRLIRVLRLLRILPLVKNLRAMVVSIVSGLATFFWAFLLVVIMIYIASMYFAQLVVDHLYATGASQLNSEELKLRYYFASVGRSMLSMYGAISGGVDWDDIAGPIIQCLHPFHGLIFSMFIAFTVLVMLNVITGAFVTVAEGSVKEDNDLQLVRQVRELFMQCDEDHSGNITWDEFAMNLENPCLQSYFKALDLDISEARGVFDLLDCSGTGELSAEEFVLGCLRLTGPAKAIDLTALMREQTLQARLWREDLAKLNNELATNSLELASIRSIFSKTVSQRPERPALATLS